MKVAVILPAAGLGTRMGRTSAETAGTSRKQFMLLDGSPILLHTVRKFASSDRVSEIVVALRREDLDWVGDLLREQIRTKPVRVVEGGNSRRSVVKGSAERLISLMLRLSYSYFQSGSSGCFRSQRGRRLWTVGISSKL